MAALGRGLQVKKTWVESLSSGLRLDPASRFPDPIFISRDICIVVDRDIDVDIGTDIYN